MLEPVNDATRISERRHALVQEVPNSWTKLAWDLNPHPPSVYYSINIGMAMDTRMRGSAVPPKGIGGWARRLRVVFGLPSFIMQGFPIMLAPNLPILVTLGFTVESSDQLPVTQGLTMPIHFSLSQSSLKECWARVFQCSTTIAPPPPTSCQSLHSGAQQEF
jgi:hypothetical protein